MNNEEKILQMLTKLTEKVDSMDGRLDRLEATQVEQGEVLAEQGKILAEQGKILAEHGKILAEMQAELTEVHEIATKVAVTQEAVVLPRLDTLADGHTHLVNTLAKKEAVEALEARQDTLEGAVQFMGKRLTALEKAQ